MRAYWVEVAEEDGLDVCTAIDKVTYYLLVYLLGVAIRALGRFYGSILRHGEVLRGGLSIDGAA